eukprot:IDg19540t1
MHSCTMQQPGEGHEDYNPNENKSTVGDNLEQEQEDMSSQYPDGTPHSVRGAPEHLRAAIRRRQNSESAKRTRVREKEDYRYLLELYQSHLSQISELEERVEALAQVLRDAGIDVPQETVGAVQQNVGESQTDDPNARTEELFEELMGALSQAEADKGASSSHATSYEEE